jgi:peptide/nickel transport system substrate-binding protein
MNTQEPPFDDVKVRQAVNYAIDPEALQRIFGGRLEFGQTILPPDMPGYKEYELYPGPDVDKAKQLLAEANPSDTDITVWTDDESDRKRIGQYYADVLTDLGFNVDLKIIAGDIYFTTIGNLKTPNLDTGFSDWFQDFPHPHDFFNPLLNGDSIQSTNNNNYSQVDIPALNKQIDELLKQPLDDVETQYGDLDEAFMKQAVWAPYGHEQFATFTSDRIAFDDVIFSPVWQQDYSSFAIED